MSIKFVKVGNEEKIVSLHDDAIDREKSDMVSYQEDYDVKKLVFKDGMKPTYFVIRNVGSTNLVEIQQDHYKTVVPKIEAGMSPEQIRSLKVTVEPVKQGEMIIKYFKAGCKKYIDNDIENEITDDVLEQIPPAIIQEIGSLVMVRSILNTSKKKS